MEKSTITKWREYAKTLAKSSVHVNYPANQASFVSTAREFANNSDKFPHDSFVMWADTENVFTSVEGIESAFSHTAILNTAFNILHYVNDMGSVEEIETVMNNCETVAWQFIQKMALDIEAKEKDCRDILHIYLPDVQMERDGPYHNNLAGVIVRIRLKMRNSIPAYNPNDWQ